MDEDEQQYMRLRCLKLAGQHERASAGIATEAVLKRAEAYLAFVLGKDAQDDDGDPRGKG